MRTFLHGLFARLGPPSEGDPGDDQLLAAFVTSRDDLAFQQIVRRHGPMVHGVCRRVLQNEADADDAFQAVFLVFLRKAESVRPGNLLGNWLYGVAVNVARKGRDGNTRRKAHELNSHRTSVVDAPGSPDAAELRDVIDQELNRLPDSFRAAVVACDIEGRTRKEAAGQLGWSEGTVASRLARARSLLADRLTRRGITVPAAGLAVALGSPVSAAIPRAVFTGHSEFSQTLAHEAMRTMTTSKLQTMTLAVLVTVGLAGVGTGIVYACGGFDNNAPPGARVAPTDDPKPGAKKPTHFTLTNPNKDIVVVSDKDEKLTEFFRRQRVMIAGVSKQEYDAAAKAKDVSEKVFVNYASYNEGGPMNATYGAYVRLAPVAAPVAEAIAAAKLAAEREFILVLTPDAKDKDVWHIAGFTTRTSVGFFASKDKKGTDDFAPADLLFTPKK